MNSQLPKVTVDLEEIENSCFVIMPFHQLFESQYERVIKPAVRQVGLKCIRADEVYTDQSVVQDIWRSIRRARVVVAELSGRNPNVLYETGLAHAIHKPIIFLTRNQSDVPFDLRALRYLFYDLNNPTWGDNLREQLATMLKNVLDEPSLAEHLKGIKVDADPPDPPPSAVQTQEEPGVLHDLTGMWSGSWVIGAESIQHLATLTIPPDPAPSTGSLTASMIVTGNFGGMQAIVRQTLTMTGQGNRVRLSGVDYTYLERGVMGSYTLDDFELELSGNGKFLNGQQFQRGHREGTFVAFKRIENTDPPPTSQ